MEIKTYRHFVCEKNVYHFFKNFKVYWAYRWYKMRQLDERGVLSPTDKTCTQRIRTNYQDAYLSPSEKIERQWR